MIITRRIIAEALSILGGLTCIAFILPHSYDAAILAAAGASIAIGAVFRPRRLIGWIPALIVSAAWILTSGKMYEGYNVFRLRIFGISAFPMIAWPSAFAFAYLYLVPLFKIRPWPLRWLILGLAYSAGLILVEWLGYNFLGVQLDAGRAYPGWPILNIFHSPWWMQAAYFVNGIAFMGIVSWMDRSVDFSTPPETAGAPWRRVTKDQNR